MPGYFVDISNADIIDIDLTNGTVNRSFTDHVLCKGDVQANYYGARLYNNGEPIHVQGTPTVTGYFLRPDHNTVLLTGEFADDATSNQGMLVGVVLSQECYAYAGQFQLAIVVTFTGARGSQTETVRVIDGTIIETHPGGTVVPGNVLPGVDTLIELIAEAQAGSGNLYKTKKYTASYTVSANDSKVIRASDFTDAHGDPMTDGLTGYTPVAISRLSTSNGNVSIIGARVEMGDSNPGNTVMMTVANMSGSSVTDTAYLDVLYILSAGSNQGLIQGGTET